MINIIAKVRDAVNDNLVFSSEIQEFVVSRVFTLQSANIDEDSLKIYKNQSPTEWDDENYDYSNGKVIVDYQSLEELEAGDTLTFEYETYNKYSNNEIKCYIRNALGYLSVEQYKTFTIETGEEIDATEEEEYLIAIVASILMKGSIKSYRTPEITIVFSEDMSVEKKIKQIIDQFDKASPSIEYINPSEEIPDEDE